MPVKIAFELSDADLEYFRKAMRDVKATAHSRDEKTIIAAASRLAAETGARELPEFVQGAPGQARGADPHARRRRVAARGTTPRARAGSPRLLRRAGGSDPGPDPGTRLSRRRDHGGARRPGPPARDRILRGLLPLPRRAEAPRRARPRAAPRLASRSAAARCMRAWRPAGSAARGAEARSSCCPDPGIPLSPPSSSPPCRMGSGGHPHATRPLAAAADPVPARRSRRGRRRALRRFRRIPRSVLEYAVDERRLRARRRGRPSPQGFQIPGGIALRPSDGVLHVSSQASGEIWRYTTATGALIVPALKTGLYGPRGLAFDASGRQPLLRRSAGCARRDDRLAEEARRCPAAR